MRVIHLARSHFHILKLYLTCSQEQDQRVSVNRVLLFLIALISLYISSPYAFEPYHPLDELNVTSGTLSAFRQENTGRRGAGRAWRMIVYTDAGKEIKFTINAQPQVLQRISSSIGSDVTIHWQQWWLYHFPIPIFHDWEAARNVSINSEVIVEYQFEVYKKVRRPMRYTALAVSVISIALLIYLNVMAWLQFGDLNTHKYSYKTIRSKTFGAE